MRNSIAAERVKAQIVHATPTPVQIYQAIQSTTLSPPISLDELRRMLMVEIAGGSVEQACATLDYLHFENIYDFSSWYGNNQNHFTDIQRMALDTILQTRSLIDIGCACKRASREAMAHQYFETFWVKNRQTDLLPTIAKITGAKKVSINSYCIYPNEPQFPA